jgi:hypothetical protein
MVVEESEVLLAPFSDPERTVFGKTNMRTTAAISENDHREEEDWASTSSSNPPSREENDEYSIGNDQFRRIQLVRSQAQAQLLFVFSYVICNAFGRA